MEREGEGGHGGGSCGTCRWCCSTMEPHGVLDAQQEDGQLTLLPLRVFAIKTRTELLTCLQINKELDEIRPAVVQKHATKHHSMQTEHVQFSATRHVITHLD